MQNIFIACESKNLWLYISVNRFEGWNILVNIWNKYFENPTTDQFLKNNETLVTKTNYCIL